MAGPTGSSFSSCPYVPRTVLTLKKEGQPATVKATIIETFEPFTLSCTTTVEIDDLQSSGLSGRYILKMYDRRFAKDLRGHARATPWDQHVENAYRQFLQSDSASLFFDYCAKTPYPDLVLDRYNWNETEKEAYFQFMCRRFYDVETQVYGRLSDRQGIDIPRFFGQVAINSLSNSSNLEGKHLDCPGILLEPILGYTLSDLAKYAPRDTWQEICEEAIQTVNRIGDRDIRNEDVKPRNFIVRKDESMEHTRPVMIDFARCVLREKGQDDHDWRYRKADQDEEGAIGRVMEMKLGGGFQYHITPEHDKLLDEFMSEEAQQRLDADSNSLSGQD